MNDIMNQIGMCRVKATDLEATEPGAANLLRMNANVMDDLLEVVESAKTLRDHCLRYAGTPPATFVCELDDDLQELEGDELDESEATGECNHNDWYENSGWRFCRQCVRHWDAEQYKIAKTARAMIARGFGAENCTGDAEPVFTVKQTEEIETETKLARLKDLEAACKAARVFIDQYGYVINTPEYTGVWKTLNDFSIGYKGPLFKDPTELKAALEKVELPLRGVITSLKTVVEQHIEDKYFDILIQVETKVPGETRHETAKRYIKDRESRLPPIGMELAWKQKDE